MRNIRRFSFVALSTLVFGCSLIAKSDPDQCKTDNDCYVKFGGSYVCQNGACSVASTQAVERTVPTLTDCRATQECVAVHGEGWLCRRDRDDAQKKGKCQELTPTAECSILGDYKNDQVVLIGAILPGKDSAGLAAKMRSGLARAVSDWGDATRSLAETNVGADAVAPPRPFAVVACTEDVARADLRNLLLNSGVTMVLGPATLRAGGTDDLSTELTTAKLPLLSSNFGVPKAGSLVGSYFFRFAGDEDTAAAFFGQLTTKPTLIVRREGAYEGLAAKAKQVLGSVTEKTYTDPAALDGKISEDTLVLGDGEVAGLLGKFQRPGADTASIYVLPSAIPDLATALAGTSIPNGVNIRSIRSARSSTIPGSAPFDAKSFGDAEAYDALFTALIALAAVPDATSVEAIKAEVLQKALVQVTSPSATTTVQALGSTLKDTLKTLRATADVKVKIDGATGSLSMSSSLATTRTWTGCSVSAAGCD